MKLVDIVHYLHYLTSISIIIMPFIPSKYLIYILPFPLIYYIIWVLYEDCPLTSYTKNNSDKLKDITFLQHLFELINIKIDEDKAFQIANLIIFVCILISSYKLLYTCYKRN